MGQFAKRVRSELGAVDTALEAARTSRRDDGRAEHGRALGPAGRPADPRALLRAENGVEILERHFANVRRQEAVGTVVFPDSATMREFVAATITRAHLADRVPVLTEPFRTRCAHVIDTGENLR